MRTHSILIVLCSGLFVQAQRPNVPPTRHGITANFEAFPQTNAKESLQSVIKLIEGKRFDYLVAHLLEPGFIDQKIAERARLLNPTVEQELKLELQRQRTSREPIDPAVRLPVNPQELQVIIDKVAQERAIKLVVQDVEAHFTENPEIVRTFKKFLRSGQASPEGNLTKMTLSDVTNAALYFQPVGTRWYVLDQKRPKGK